MLRLISPVPPAIDAAGESVQVLGPRPSEGLGTKDAQGELGQFPRWLGPRTSWPGCPWWPTAVPLPDGCELSSGGITQAGNGGIQGGQAIPVHPVSDRAAPTGRSSSNSANCALQVQVERRATPARS